MGYKVLIRAIIGATTVNYSPFNGLNGIFNLGVI